MPRCDPEPAVEVVDKPAPRLPPRFLGPPPASAADFFHAPYDYPPRGYLVERLGACDREVRSALVRALRSAATRERPFDLQLTFGAVLREGAAPPRGQRWLQRWRADEDDPRVRAVLAYALGESGPREPTPPPPRRPDLDALEAHARAPERDAAAAVRAREGLRELARHDRPRAVVAARALLAAAPHPFARPVACALDQLPEPGALERWLAGHGLLEAPRPHERGCWAEAALERRGSVVSYDRDELYEDLLYRLASATGGALQGVHFEELPPEAGARHAAALAELRLRPVPGVAPVILYAHDGPRAYATLAAPGGHDLAAARGLLNRCLRERGSPLRLARLHTDRPRVVAGPVDGLRAAAERELMLLEP